MDDDKWITGDHIARGAAAVRRVAELEKTLRECRPLLVHAGCPVDWLDAVLNTTDRVRPVDEAQRLVDECAPFLKEGETPAQCIERNRKDANTAIGAYYNDAHRYRALRAMWLDREGEHAATIEMCRADTVEQFDKALDEARAIAGVGLAPGETK